MSKIIIGIHGLGNKPPKELLEKWWIKSIREGLRRIDKYVFNPKFEIVYWADVLNDKPLDKNIRNKKDPYYLDEKYISTPKNFTPKPNNFRKKILDFLKKELDKIFLNADLSINYSFISDFILHKYFKELEIYYKESTFDKNENTIRVKDVIRNKTTEILQKHKRDEILLIGHSMGSIIAYDVLTFTLPEMKIDTFVTIGSPLGMPIIKSKIAVEQNLQLHNTGNKLQTPAGIKKSWYNYSDLEDKVALNYDLSDDYAENSNGVKAIDILINNNYEIDDEKNPHNAFGYLRAPEFSRVVFEFLVHGRSKPVLSILNSANNIYEWLIKIAVKLTKVLNSFITRADNES